MNRAFILYCFILISLIFKPLDIAAQYYDLDLAREQARKLADNVLIVRLPVNGPKIRFYQNKIRETEDTRIKQKIKNELERSEKLNQARLRALMNALQKEYTFSKYLIMPDSNYHPFIKGKQEVFLNARGEVDPSYTLSESVYFIMIAGENEDQWVLVNAGLKQLDRPFPVRATIFLSGLTRVLNRQRYYEKQFRWFNQKLKELL